MVNIIYDKDDQPVGWEITPKTDEEQETAAIIRDLQFFGFESKAIKYKGLELIDETKGKSMGNIKSLTWLQKIHQL